MIRARTVNLTGYIDLCVDTASQPDLYTEDLRDGDQLIRKRRFKQKKGNREEAALQHQREV